MSKTTLPALSAEGGLSSYLRAVRAFPVLAAEEEYMLAKRWREHGDAAAAHRLVTSHLRLSASIAIGFRNYGLPVADLIGEGNVGLMRAVRKFDPEVGVRLATYAMWWIKAQIHEYVLNSWSMVKIGTQAAQKKLFFNLRRLKAKLNIVDVGELSDEAVGRIATELQVAPAEVVSMNRRLQGRDASLNRPVGEDGELEVLDLLPDDAASPETVVAEQEESGQRRRLLAASMQALSERERHILAERRLKDEPSTLEDLGRVYGISRERIRQIENRAFAKLQAAMLAAPA